MDEGGSQEPKVDLYYEVKQVDWENENAGNLFERLWNTWRKVMFEPLDSFAELPPSGGLGKPLLFALISTGFGMAVSSGIQIALQACFTGFMGMASGGRALVPGLLSVGFSLGFLVAMPFWIAAVTFLWAGTLHLFVKAFGGAQGFEATFRIVCYAQAPNALTWIPFVGGFAYLYGTVVRAIGVLQVHEMDTWKGVFAVILGSILAGGAMVGLWVAVAFVIFAPLAALSAAG